jgi:hypothetical protein
MTQQRERVGVGPVHVVEHEQGGPVGGHVVEQRAYQLEREVALTGTAHRNRRRAARRQQTGQRPVVRGQPVIGVGGRQPVEQALQRLDPRMERHERVLVTAAEQHGAALSVHAPRKLRGERRLADPRLAADERHTPFARHGGRPRLLESRQRGPAALGWLGGGQGGRQRRGGRRGDGRRRGSQPAAADILDERARRDRRGDAQLGAQALAHREGGGERGRAITVEREQTDQLAMRRLGQRLDIDAAARPCNRGGDVAGGLCAGGQGAEHGGELGGELVAGPQRPVGVEAVEQLPVPHLRGGLEVSLGDATAEVPKVDADRGGQADLPAGDLQRVAAFRSQRPPELVQRVAQRLARALFGHVGSQAPGERGAGVRPGRQRQPGQQLTGPGVGGQLDRPAVHFGHEASENAQFEH